MGSIGLAYFVTLCLYPGIMSEIISCKLGSWMPVILMTAFNASDVIGKVYFNVYNIFLYVHILYIIYIYFIYLQVFLLFNILDACNDPLRLETHSIIIVLQC